MGDLGLCAMYQGLSNVKPQHFVCNVGHIPCTDDWECWTEDLLHTAHGTREIVKEFAGSVPEDLGLISNIICLIFKTNQKSFFSFAPDAFREFNFSAWESEKHAHEWYVNSPAHNKVLRQHSNKEMSPFGNTLATLVPKRPIRWQERCSSCACLLNGYPENHICACGGAAHPMPLF